MVGVLLVLVDLMMRLLVIEKEGKLAIEDLIGNDPDREDIVFLGKSTGGIVALRRAVRHGEARRVLYVMTKVRLGQISG